MSSHEPADPATLRGEPDVGGNARVSRMVTVMLGVIGAVVLAAGVRAAAEILAPAMLALVLTIAVLPVGAWARRHGWPGWLGTLTSLVAAYAILLVLLIGSIVCLIKLVDLLPQYAGDAQDLTTRANDTLSRLGIGTDATKDALSHVDPGKVADILAGLLSGILGALGGLFFLVTLMFFFVVAAPGFRPRTAWLRVSKPHLAGSLAKFVNGTQRYLVITALFGAIVGVLDAGALWLIGVPLPLVWGFFSFITNFIPNIGFVIGIIPPALLALLDSGWEGMVLVLVVYSVLNVTIQTFIQPRFVGNTVGLSAELTFLSLVVWTFLLGPLGALLAVPMTLLLRAFFIDSDPRAAWVAPLIDAQVEGPPQETAAADAPAMRPKTDPFVRPVPPG
ncbi:MAG TPA: AI-2E family transporter [Intrasporangium sp.]|nr:AI-2E family transporter [Intrasporangium sp.]